MELIKRGVKNAFRNNIRTLSIVIILGLSIALSLSMLVAHQAVNKKIDTVKSSVGNTITISPAGFRGFNGGGNQLTVDKLSAVTSLANINSVAESLSDRLASTDTNLLSSIEAGSLGQRFSGGGGGFGGPGGDSAGGNQTFTPPVTVLGTTAPTNLSNTQGGGTFALKSGQVFDANSAENVAIVGTSLATKNNLIVGSTFTAYGATIKVVGIFDAGNTFSNSQLIMPLNTLQALSAQPNDITSAVVTADSVDSVDSLTSAIKSKLGAAADVTSSKDQAATAIAPLENIKSISLYSLIGAVVAGAVIIFLTMLMIVRERRREIGVLKAIGASNLKVVGQFMVEAVTLTLLGAVIGIIIGTITAEPITKTLVNNSTSSTSTNQTPGGPAGGAGGGFAARGSGTSGATVARGGGFRGGIKSNISSVQANVGLSIIAYGIGAALLIALIGSSIASFTISKIRPAEVMRTE
jgi:putative ABC transport system permease protein